MKKHVLVVILFLFVINLSAKDVEIKEDKNRGEGKAWQPKFQYENFGFNSFNIGLSRIKYSGDHITDIPILFHGYYLDLGVAINSDDKLFLTKVGYEFFCIAGGRVSLVSYTDFKDNQFCLRPEIGLSLFSFLTITYGYNINLNSADYFDIERGIVSVNIGLLFGK
jgi:hypothetical protein